uniref:Carbonic anhydrase n=1 Tax=Haemonchus contortus TaxID=6289 RepID=A0A7I4Z052_HAECO
QLRLADRPGRQKQPRLKAASRVGSVGLKHQCSGDYYLIPSKLIIMNRILRGVVKFRQTVRKELTKQFDDVGDHPKPMAVMFTCMDSRMLPTRFTQSNVGDMFVVRNAGNMIPDAPHYGTSSDISVTTEPAALELAITRGGIRHIIVCGHSDCKAMNLLHSLHQCPKNFDIESPMDHWVRRNGFRSMKRLNERLHKGGTVLKFGTKIAPSQDFEAIVDPLDKLPVQDKLSQINVLQQLENIASHEFLKEHFESGNLFVHGMWFDIYNGDDYLFSRDKKRFVLIDEETVSDLMAELEHRCGRPSSDQADETQT